MPDTMSLGEILVAFVDTLTTLIVENDVEGFNYLAGEMERAIELGRRQLRANLIDAGGGSVQH